MCLQLLSLDRDLGSFFNVLDAEGIDYSVVLTADHGGMDIPERLRAKGVSTPRAPIRRWERSTSARRSPPSSSFQGQCYLAILPMTCGSTVRLRRGTGRAWSGKPSLSTRRIRRSRPSSPRGRSAAFRCQRARPTNGRSARRVRASCDRQRSGDLYVVLKRNVSPIVNPGVGYVATHGSVWDYDRRVPILFWRRGMRSNAPPGPYLHRQHPAHNRRANWPCASSRIGRKMPEWS